MSAQPDIESPRQPLAVLASSPPAAETPPPEHPPEAEHPPHRKIAQLPKVFRELINSMLDDSVPYRRMIEKLEQRTDPPLPYPISEMNISRWKETGYRRHLARQDCLAALREHREGA